MSSSTHSHRKHSSSRNGARGRAEAETTVNHLISSAGQMVEGGYEKASEVARSSYEHGRDMAVAIRDDASDFVQERPMESVLLAAGVGLVIGFMLGRKH